MKYNWLHRSNKICKQCKIKRVKEWNPDSKFCSIKCFKKFKKINSFNHNSNKLNPLHRWVERKLGKPKKCDMCDIIVERTTQIHWANKSHEYKRDLNDWLRLCVRCHSKYDRYYHKNLPEKLGKI